MVPIVKQKIEEILHQIFEFSILIKVVNGIWETTLGLIILFLNKPAFKFLGPHNIKVFIATYLLIHGVLNLFLAVQLYRDKIWAYSATIILTIIFIIYQIDRIIMHRSIFLISITLFDILFTVLTWHEYNRKKQLKMV